MLLKIFIILFVLNSFLYCGERYKDRLFGVVKKKDIVYVESVPFLHNKHMVSTLVSGLSLPSEVSPTLYLYQNTYNLEKKSLLFDLYEPKEDFAVNRAMVVVVHGGGFVSGNKEDVLQQSVRYCDSLAARGFVVASIDYRKGMVLLSKENQLIVDSSDFKRAVLWGAEDLDSAIHYFRLNARKLKINPNKIFVLGNSSGAIVALQNIYGNFENRADAVVSLWGAILDYTLLVKLPVVPILLVHGTDDFVIPFYKRKTDVTKLMVKGGNFFGYGTLSSAFKIHFEGPVFYGSKSLDSILSLNKVPHENVFVEGGGHELYSDKKFERYVWKKVIDFLFNLAY